MSEKLMPGMLPVADVMRRLGLKRSAFYEWVRLGRLGRPVRLGRRAYLPVESVRKCEQWLKDQSMKTQRV